MHIGLNLVFLTPGEQGGMEIYARELIPRLLEVGPQHQYTAFVNRDAAAVRGPWNELIGSVTVPVHASNRIEWVQGEQRYLPRAAERAGIDLLHSLASTAPGWGRFRRVVTIHDLIYRALPEVHAGVRSLGMRVLVPLAARRSDRVITDSEATRRDLIKFLKTPEPKIDVVPLGVGLSRAATPMPEAEIRRWLGSGSRPVVLSVSAKLAHKNLMRLLGALASIDPQVRPVLVLPGYSTPHEAELRQRASQLGLAADVRFLGWISTEELEGLYAVAACVVLPSLIEGFGLPVLEAMTRGRPVACSDRGALAEVAGDAALRFDPRSESAIADAITQLLDNPALCARLSAAGPERAAQFSWKATAAGTLAAYERAGLAHA
jgi:glycosyltransferase involved in cell wall biosynthesis